MRVLELSLRNYRVFEQVDLELPARVIGIFGPNGAGKSALVEAILYSLYGQARTAKQDIRTHGVLTDCEVRLVFQHGGQQYEVRRTIRGKNHQTEAEILVGDLSLAVGVQEVDAEIRRLLRMDHQVFRASVFAEQKQLDAFSDLTKARRKEMVLRLLGIKPVDEARGAARLMARDTKRDADRMAGQLPDPADLERQVKGAGELAAKARHAADEAATVLQTATARLAETKDVFDASEKGRIEVERIAALRAEVDDKKQGLDRRHAELLERAAALAKVLEGLPALERELADLEGARERVDAARRWTEAAERLTHLEREAEAVPDVDPATALAELEAAEAALKQADRAAAKAESAHERVQEDLEGAADSLEAAGDLDPSKPCPTCGQPLGAAFRDVVSHRKQELSDLRKKATAAAKDAREAEAARKRAQKLADAARTTGELARRAGQQREHIEKQLGDLRAQAEKLAAAFGAETPVMDVLEAAAERADELSSQVASLRAEQKHLGQMESDREAVEKDLLQCATRLEELADEARRLDFDPERHATLLAQFDEATAGFDQARNDERQASDAAKDAEKDLAALEADLNRVREVAAQVGELREEARYVERVSLLLDGFRDHLVSRIGPELSREAEALFRELTNHEYEDLRIDEEDLSIRVADSGVYFPIERFSGSEADLANLALRVAISMHLSRMSGADIGMMVLDEVLGALDEERKDLMVQALGRLADRFHQLFVITHAEQLKDQFGASVEVRKVGRRRSQAVLV
ncbi:MAG TPA: SMC family ATPase [Actinomycetota bacterium]|nr:SMC family ATPase [Actinomycetota bacterium]